MSEDGVLDQWAKSGISTKSDLLKNIQTKNKKDLTKQILYKVFDYNWGHKWVEPDYTYAGNIKISENEINNLNNEGKKFDLYSRRGYKTAKTVEIRCNDDGTLKDRTGNELYLRGTFLDITKSNGGNAKKRKTIRKKRNSKKTLKTRRGKTKLNMKL